MGIFSGIRPKAMTSDALERLIIETFGSTKTASGQTINSTTAMQAMAVHSCVKIKADSIAQLLPLIHETQRKQELWLYRLLTEPGEWMTAPGFGGCVLL